MDALNWRKASHSAANGGGCVEAASTPGTVLIRDTTDRSGPVLRLSPDAWRGFAEQVKRSLSTGPTWGLPISVWGYLRVSARLPPFASPGLVVLGAGGRPGYAAAFGAGLAVQRAFIIAPMRCSALALAWM
jgi:hypothetical protein